MTRGTRLAPDRLRAGGTGRNCQQDRKYAQTASVYHRAASFSVYFSRCGTSPRMRERFYLKPAPP